MQCKALILKTNSLSLFTAQLQASGHVFTPTSEAAFGKGGTLRLGFRKTGRHIAALTLEQMCRLFYLKRANEGALFDHPQCIEWIEGVPQDCPHLRQHPVFCHLLDSVHFGIFHRAGLFNDIIYSVPICCA